MKKLQILCINNDLVQTIDLQIGNNVIGQRLVRCDDGQIIKHATTISLSADREMTITPVSPCYMKSTGSSQWQLLKLGASVPINPGDICCLVPYKCWFKVILSSDKMEDIQNSILKRKAIEDVNCNISNKKTCLESGEGDNLQFPNDLLNEMLRKTNEMFKTPKETINKEHLSDTTASNAMDQNVKDVHATSSKDEDMKSESETNESQKISHSSCVEQDASEHQSIIKEAVAVVTSKNELGSTKNLHPINQDEKLTTAAAGSLAAPRTTESNVSDMDTTRRDKCAYGNRCYRRNSYHKEKFSHPGDSDYDIPDDREECPYGIHCYRKSSQHKTEFKHTAIRNSTRGRNRRRDVIASLDEFSDLEDLSGEESIEESVDESDYEPWDSESEWD